jgi:hypothetical protein
MRLIAETAERLGIPRQRDAGLREVADTKGGET